MDDSQKTALKQAMIDALHTADVKQRGMELLATSTSYDNGLLASFVARSISGNAQEAEERVDTLCKDFGVGAQERGVLFEEVKRERQSQLQAR